jgi:hypothetical protein
MNFWLPIHAYKTYPSHPFHFIIRITPYFIHNVYEVDINSDKASGVASVKPGS